MSAANVMMLMAAGHQRRVFRQSCSGNVCMICESYDGFWSKGKLLSVCHYRRCRADDFWQASRRGRGRKQSIVDAEADLLVVGDRMEFDGLARRIHSRNSELGSNRSDY